MQKFAFIIIMLLSSSSWGLDIEFKGSEYLESEVRSALGMLPDNYLSLVKNKILIRESSLRSDTLMSDDLCEMDEGVQFGLTRRNTISISAKLVTLAQTQKRSFDCSHGSFKKLLTAVIIHELTHIKDNIEKISVDPDFQRIVGVKRVQRSSRKKLINQNHQTSPDAYEFKNLEESLAVNTEYLVLDPEFECRKPATANFLARRLGIRLRGVCKKNSKVLIQSAYLEDNYLLSVDIDPTRIYQVHYLFAGKGQALMSRWGHAMFRLVVCAPFRKTVGPECLDDVSHHLALSYRAYMSDMNVSYTKGIFGKYPSQLFIMRYLEVQQEYNKFDLRDLYSIPLKLTKNQKNDFLDLTIERFWTYQGKYYFFDNNCGTETQKHLGVALDEDQAGLVRSITPLQLYRDITRARNELTHESANGLSRDEMIEKNFITLSMFEELNDAYQYLRELIPAFGQRNFKTFIKASRAEDRMAAYSKLVNDLDSEVDLKFKRQVIMKLVYLERYLSSRFIMEVPQKIMKLMRRDKDLKAEIMKMGQSLMSLSFQPWEVIDSDYGVPTAMEFDHQFPLFVQKRKNQLGDSIEKQMNNLQNILNKKHFSEELKEIEKLKEIKHFTNKLVLRINQL